jgi:glucose/mannose-6-phosphate isomerase
MSLDDLALIERADPSRTRDVLAGFPVQCRAARALRVIPSLSAPRPGLVVLAGMGGSAAGADLIAACAVEHLNVPILVHRGYGLPACAGKNTLVVASSYSGDTEEAVSAVETALERSLPVVILTAGGRLGQRASAQKIPRVTLPGGLMPRMALGYLFFPVLTVFGDTGLGAATDGEIDEALAVLTALADELAPARPIAQNEAKQIALAIGERVPVFYGGQTTGGVAYRWKTDVEENAKRFALAGAIPEMNHNEVEAWRAPAGAAMRAVFLRDRQESPEIARRFRELSELIAPATGDVVECWSRGAGRPARLLGLAYMSAWTSYYLAVGFGVDPWPVPLLDEIKRRLRAG